MVRSEDYYQILEIELNATNLDIRRAYRRLALKWHPDKNLDNIHESTRKFKQISEAYQILGDLIRRRDYDYDLVRNHRPTPPPPPPEPPKQPPAPPKNKEDFDEFKDYNKRRGSTASGASDSSRSTSFDESGTGSSSDAKSSESESDSKPETRKSPPEYHFRNPYDVFDEFFGSHLFSRHQSQNVDQGEAQKSWPTPVIHYKDKELQARRSIVKKMTMVGEGGCRTTIKIKTVTMRENGREKATVSESFENGILRSTSVKDESGQMTTFH